MSPSEETSSEDVVNPLEINLRRQLNALLEQLPQELLESFTTALSYNALLPTLSHLMLNPSLTLKITRLFRPLLMDLCARWLDTGDQLLEKLEALGLLIECHEELYPILSELVYCIQDSPLKSLKFDSKTDNATLHRILLAYYRFLRAIPSLPKNLGWDLSLLLNLIGSPHSDRGTRWLAIRCFTMQANMGEKARSELETEFLGENKLDECPIGCGRTSSEELVGVDGWMLPMLEDKRIREYRNELLDSTEFYAGGDSDIKITDENLSPRIINISGILLLCNSQALPHPASLIPTASTTTALRNLALNYSIRRPILLSSSPASGKTTLLEELCRRIHPGSAGRIVTIHLSDTSLDPRTLLGSYVSSQKNRGTFEWKDGVLVRALREGKWIVLKDIDKASNDVLSLINPLLETMGDVTPIGSQARLYVPGRGEVCAAETFSLFATRSVEYVDSKEAPKATFLGAHKWNEVVVPENTLSDIQLIIDKKFPKVSGCLSRSLIDIWQTVKQQFATSSSSRFIGFRDLEKLCSRVSNLLYPGYTSPAPSDQLLPLEVLLPHPALREEIYFEANAIFFAHGVTNKSALEQRSLIAYTVGEKMGLSKETCEWILKRRTPFFEIEKNIDGLPIAVKAGRLVLPIEPIKDLDEVMYNRPFSLHKQAIRLLTHLSACVVSSEPVLLTGETGTGKTSIISYLASLLNKPIVSLNLSNQSESSDLIGGFRPINTRIPASELQSRFLELFQRTFSKKKNERFQQGLRKAFAEGKWKAVVKLWMETSKMALDKIRASNNVEDIRTHGDNSDSLDSTLPRKRQKRTSEKSSETDWTTFEADVRNFEVQYILNKNQLSFDFEEGPLVKAIRAGKWVLLDEINLASADTLECISSLLQGPTASITLTEKGSFEPIPRHTGFRLFACMNPATDVGKRELPRNIRAKFTEIDVPPPDEDQEALIDVITHYIGHIAVADKSVIADIAQFYTSIKRLSEAGKLADESDRRPHYSMRSLSRALTFAVDTVQIFGLRRAIWEGHIMAFTMVLDQSSLDVVLEVAQTTLLKGVKNIQHFLSIIPSASAESAVKFGPFSLALGPNELEEASEYVLTPSVQKKLSDLSRIIMTQRYPILIEGPTSSGKTSAIQYLARRTGHNFVRINNHEHTDIQEYIGSYVSDPKTGKLVYRDGLLVRALRRGDWIVLDELNLAPTDVLEALNRLLDDNRELVIPETQEVLKPHPSFMLFATQNPSGTYAGRKVLSRALRNRFLEVHFSDVPAAELEFILCQKSRIAPSYSQRMVATFHELQKRRQTGRVFEGKEGFATLRDLFRWAQRNALGYQELAENGYMLLAERVRNEDDKKVVKEVLETIMNVTISEEALYNIETPSSCSMNGSIVWTKPLKRLFVLLSRALSFDEPVLLVGETGTGKTSVCQVYADTMGQVLRTVNCHQNTEASDIIGGLRPVRLRDPLESPVVRKAMHILHLDTNDVNVISEAIGLCVSSSDSSGLSRDEKNIISDAQNIIQSTKRLLEWQDGPLVTSMRLGGAFLLDEISLADDSVLERLNSVLEPSRTLVLAEKGGDKVDDYQVSTDPRFKFIATMNPGGDFGKKELSPALRNRFTEIWVPTMMKHDTLFDLVKNSWKNDRLLDLTIPLLNFVTWFQERVRDDSILSLRDVLGWVEFCNSLISSHKLSPSTLFVHGGEMTIVDGLSTLPQLSGWSEPSINTLKQDVKARLRELIDMPHRLETFEVARSSHAFRIGPFSVSLGAHTLEHDGFSFESQTTLQNAFRLVRACQLSKPILLEGSPGVGKTSLVSALAASAGRKLLRINLSDQTDLVDLFGSDLPVNGNAVGSFAWNDAEFLQALKNGDWVLLDEMNLASQSVLEGLNAVFDHRGTVYIPELDRSFSRHHNFRVFAAQNPLSQGGGRKGLPKSFLNRFTKVYVDKLTGDDLFTISRRYYPNIEPDTLKRMIKFNELVHEQVSEKRMFGASGSPWEFNLRDIMRWATLITRSSLQNPDPWQYLYTVYGARFRTEEDRQSLYRIFMSTFNIEDLDARLQVRFVVSPESILCGGAQIMKGKDEFTGTGSRILPSQFGNVEAAFSAISNSWLVIVVGKQGTGKTNFVRSLASVVGNSLKELSLGGASDISDLIGSFEQTSSTMHFDNLYENLSKLLDEIISHVADGDYKLLEESILAKKETVKAHKSGSISSLLMLAKTTLSSIVHLQLPCDIKSSIETLSSILERSEENQPQLEWVDGPLVRAMRRGDWLLLDNANLCNASVLDRLNSLCEVGGSLVLTEKGVNQEVIHPHPKFRLFMTVDPFYGEISRAMRNRGIEIALTNLQGKDEGTIRDASRIPSLSKNSRDRVGSELMRRGVSRSNNIPIVARPDPCLSNLVYTDSWSSHLINLQRLISLSGDSDTDDSLSLILLELSRGSYPGLITRLLDHLQSTQSVLYKAFLSLLQFAYPVLLKALEGLNVSEQFLHPYYSQPYVNWVRPLDGDHFKLSNALFEAYFFAAKLHGVVSEHKAKSCVEQEKLILQNTNNHSLSQLFEFIEVLLSTTHQIFVLLPQSVETSSSVLELNLKLLHITIFLAGTLSYDVPDFSTLMCATQWIYDCLQGSPSLFEGLNQKGEIIRNKYSLQKGHHIVDIWQALLPTKAADISVQRLTESQIRLDERKQRFDEEIVAHRVFKASVEREPKVSDLLSRNPSQLMGDLHSLAFELGSLAGPNKGMNRTDLEGNLIISTIIKKQNSLYDDQNYLTDPSRLSRAHTAWLNALWDYTSATKKDPSIFFSPVSLGSLITVNSNTRSSPLRDISILTDIYKTMAQQSVLECHQSWNPEGLHISLLLQGVLLVLYSCNSRHRDAITEQQELYNSSGDYKMSISGLLGLGSDVWDSLPELRVKLQRVILAIEWPELLNALGLCWIALSRALIIQYVPNLPVDPIRIQGCTKHFTLERASWIKKILQHHITLEGIRTGCNSNFFVDDLQGRLQETTEKLPEANLLNRQEDPLGLTTFWKEVNDFIKDVLSPERLHRIEAISEYDNFESLVSQEILLQDSIANFIQRIKTAYTNFQDLVPALELALVQLRFGLRAVLHSAKMRGYRSKSSLVTELLGFPSNRSWNALKQVTSHEIIQPSFTHYDVFLFQLEEILLQVNCNGITKELLKSIGSIYEKGFVLWSKDVEKEIKRREEAQSIYKSNTVENSEEDEDLNREVLRMFPTFLDQDDTNQNVEDSESSKPKERMVFGREFLDMHLQLFGTKNQTQRTLLGSKESRKMKFVASLNDDLLPVLTCSLDRDCLAFRLKHLLSSSLQFQGETNGDAYSFYRDANFLEARKVSEIIMKLRDSISNLTIEWPDQLVLQHLRDRCDAILSINLNSPVAKFLSAVERLLIHTEDWEMYANRQNTLAEHRKTLTTLIVEWRTLELRGWKSLLETEARTFCDDMGEWWFRLYESSIRGVMVAEHEASLSTYFENLVPLLEEFITTSPLGQYSDRLLMIITFSELARHLSSISDGQMESALIRSSDMLASIYSYYEQFTPRIFKYLSSQRELIEEDIRNLVKLASWRDVNVYALQQSAHRTHRQLYKRVKKFRELLKQSVSVHLTVENVTEVDFESKEALVTVVQPKIEYPLEVNRPLLKKFIHIVSTGCEEFPKLVPTSSAKDLSSKIVFVGTEIQEQTPPADLEKSDRGKWAASLLHRKRRFWNDLLKELKDFGIPANVKPDVLRRHRSRWEVLERSQVKTIEDTSIRNSLDTSDVYHSRCIGLLYNLLKSTENHHPDLSTRELQRGLSLFESLFSVAVSVRESVINSASTLGPMEQSLQRLRTFENANSVMVVPSARSVLTKVGEMVRETKYAINELMGVDCNMVKLTGESPASLFDPSYKRLVNSTSKLERYKEKIESALFYMRDSWVLTEAEVGDVQESQILIEEVKDELVDLSHTCPRLRIFSEDIQKWITQLLASSSTLDIEIPEQPSFESEDLTRMLLNIAQGLHFISSKQDYSNQLPGQLRQTISIFDNIAKVLRIESVHQSLCAVYDSYRGFNHQTIREFTPFLDGYLRVVKSYLLALSGWNETLIKLTYDLGILLLNISQKGFCKPQEVEESGSAEGKAEPASEGTGLGQGSGEQNISEQIEDESQLEGTSGQDDSTEKGQQDAENDSLEVGFDFGGDLEDVSDELSEAEDEEEMSEVDDEFGHDSNDALKPIDEEFWDEKDEKDEKNSGESKEEVGAEEQTKLETNAQEMENSPNDKDKLENQNNEVAEVDSEIPEVDLDEIKGDAEGQDDDIVGDEDTDPRSPETSDQIDELDLDPNVENDSLDELSNADVDSSDSIDEAEGNAEDINMVEEVHEEEKNEEQESANADITEGATYDDSASADKKDDVNSQPQDSRIDEKDKAEGSQPQAQENQQWNSDANRNEDALTGNEVGSSDPHDKKSTQDSQRVLGDAAKEVLRRFDEIEDAMDVDSNNPYDQGGEESSHLEYVADMSQCTEMQALGPAMDKERPSREGINFTDDNNNDNQNEETNEHADEHTERIPFNETEPKPTKAPETNTQPSPNEKSNQDSNNVPYMGIDEVGEVLNELHSLESENAANRKVEKELIKWNAEGKPEDDCQRLWQLYETLTQKLSFSLCEQLRLILEPTKATRLMGDFRTGKRLNMKKVLPYIASNYTKDKIWLRRVRPSQREYQVLIALDDSKSMSESHAIHLAFQTLALVSKALTRLEAGDIAIASFGEKMQVLHGFDDGPFTDDSGVKIMKSYSFSQTATNVRSLLESTMEVLTRARERRLSSANLWQLEIIISDGICHDHEELHAILRKAEEEHILVVFIIIDSRDEPNSQSPLKSSHQSNSILNMSHATYRTVQGCFELQMQPYMNSFPFEYFVIIKDVEALPDVLSNTLRQFFERISMS